MHSPVELPPLGHLEQLSDYQGQRPKMQSQVQGPLAEPASSVSQMRILLRVHRLTRGDVLDELPPLLSLVSLVLPSFQPCNRCKVACSVQSYCRATRGPSPAPS